MNSMVKDITDADFEAAVIERSKTIPVVIDLWAPWCGPCRQLTPILESVAAARAGEFELVKLNVDENPQVAGMLGARSIPLVVAFRDGQPVSQFMGLQPESAVNQFIDQLKPGEVDLLLAEVSQRLSANQVTEAESLLREILNLEPGHELARITLAQLLSSQGQHADALTMLDTLPSSGHDDIARAKAEIRTRMAGTTDLEEVRSAWEQAPEDPDAGIRYAQGLAAAGDYEKALPLLLEIVQQHKDSDARQVMLDLFEVLGASSPLTREYRRKLARAIF